MKKTIYKPFRFLSAAIFSLIAAALLIASGCNKQDVQEQDKINYEKVVLSGCNLGYDLEDKQTGLASRSPLNTSINTTDVLITHTNNSINVHINLYYICKDGAFDTEVKVIDEVIHFYLIDTCEDISDCYARCMCNYLFDFVFSYQGAINKPYKIILIDPREEQPIVVAEGVIEV